VILHLPIREHTVIRYPLNREHCYCNTLPTESGTLLLLYFNYRIGNTVTVILCLPNREHCYCDTSNYRIGNTYCDTLPTESYIIIKLDTASPF